MKKSAFIFSSKFGDFKLPEDFPYDIDRSLKIADFCKQHGLLGESWMKIIEARKATDEEILIFHTKRFLDAIKKISEGYFERDFLDMGFGGPDNPVFRFMYDYVCLAAGASLTAAECILEDNYKLAFNPSGGLHHAGKEKAEGFCYVNDVVIAIEWMRRKRPGIRICYLDLDAHHPNGVQDAFYNLQDVLCISMHQTGKTIYPYGGFENEIGDGEGRGFNINVPLEPMSDDEIFMKGFDEVVIPAITKFKPDILVGQLGVDMLHSDPLTNLNVTSHSYAYAASSLVSFGYPILALGGGGYRRETYIQTNAMIWATLNGLDEDSSIRTVIGGVYLGDPGIQTVATLKEPRRYTMGEEKKNAMDSIERTIQYLKKNIPLLE